ncbi:hypothetical protein BFO01nite_48820 [Brevibacillus formosus]|uniref:Uncharacterized protein n=1 Tax=Brevibacillus formosus TaxID=54913 RepID=A0ABQ0TC15_9BACL|nr:hypothetical protein BFO01nite_48820 [Brevibacillus formosus]
MNNVMFHQGNLQLFQDNLDVFFYFTANKSGAKNSVSVYEALPCLFE